MTTHANKDHQVASLCLGAAAIVLGIALYLSGGFYNVRALQLLTLAYALFVLAIALRNTIQLETVAQWMVRLVLVAGLAYQFYLLSFEARTRGRLFFS
ncbi:MAG TPA: hypothetical protein VE863_08495 [Pyrinomonadaceae bacterium]|nr:hypothetical protein [Pyrinomonadaceae bacterium]